MSTKSVNRVEKVEAGYNVYFNGRIYPFSYAESASLFLEVAPRFPPEYFAVYTSYPEETETIQ